ncbi:MAG: hypothetical protein JRJ56_01365 [Deltaproteobacteria bacterium]|nr:hypothetical protein [Deltaproteobacteria bacterium]
MDNGDFAAIRTETMARLLLSQGHWQQAREIYAALYAQDPAKHAHLKEALAAIDREHPEAAARVDRTRKWRRQIDYLNRLLAQLRPAAPGE